MLSQPAKLHVILTHAVPTFKRRGFIPRGPHLCDEERPVTDDVADNYNQRQFDGLQLGAGDGRRSLWTAVTAGVSAAAARRAWGT